MPLPSGNQALKEFNTFLKEHKVEGERVFYTHTAFGFPWGKFNIGEKEGELEKFFELYGNALQVGADLHITERPKKVGPLLIDVDFHFDLPKQEDIDKEEKRLYKEDDIKYVIGTINSIIKSYFKCDTKNLLAFSLEKDKATVKVNKTTDEKEFKDGFHIIYPYLPVSEEMRYLILHEVKSKIESSKGFRHIPFTNQIDEVFDMSIIKRNGWMMYGSRKDAGPWYKLKHIYDYSFQERDITKYKHRDLVKILSNRKFSDTDSLELKDTVDKEALTDKIQEVLEKYGANPRNQKEQQQQKKKDKGDKGKEEAGDDEDGEEDNNIYDDETEEFIDEDIKSMKTEILNRRKEQTKLRNKKNKSKEIKLARSLAEILSDKRAINYHDWIKVGWALHNVSENLLPVFKEFSKKAGKKYNEKSCDEVWLKAQDRGLTIASLRHWAKIDSPDAYDELLTHSVNELMVEAESGTEYDVAKVVFELYKDQYKCTAISNNIWYEFQEHRWVEVEGGYTLSTKISEELTKEFAMLNSLYLKQMSKNKGQDTDGQLKRANNVMRIMNNLKKSGFKDRVIKECKNMFYDTTFEEKLDSNRDLIGFNNGVYDLIAGTFRAGCPDDLVSLTVGYDWKEYTVDHEYIVGIKDFFSKVQRDEDMREYILTLLASYLNGHTKSEQFVLWTGTGSNGKSKTVEFFQMAFGDYCGVLPVTVLTRKRAGSGAATPELAGQRGRRFIVFQEPENTDEIQVGFMKELTGGDWIYARPLFRDPIRYKPQFKLLLTCNKLPFIPSSDGGTWRRLRVSPWESEFTDVPKYDHQFKKDPELLEKFELWKKAFLWYLLKVYYPKFLKNGLPEPPKVTQFTNKYKKQSDLFFEFLDSNLTFTKDNKHFESHDVLYAALKYWYNESYAGRCPYAKKDLFEYLSNNNYKTDKNYLYGVRFKNDGKDEPVNELDK
ncbi:MAG: D5-like helicase-primase [Barrevirus sp.]|uniref:D5-like helicase-primase n=1 Tax=Barrevirus sp. TaxID=2487763 RepID=A0A3G4ZTJ9_9VIRU|nr:MAG: D5-like helicase-primase [Barrevirus sp.]